ncbi:unnamed protein product, partial [Ectocarpus fasciculatus]
GFPWHSVRGFDLLGLHHDDDRRVRGHRGHDDGGEVLLRDRDADRRHRVRLHRGQRERHDGELRPAERAPHGEDGQGEGVHHVEAFPAEVRTARAAAVQVPLQEDLGAGQLRHPREPPHDGANQPVVRAVSRCRGSTLLLAGMLHGGRGAGG